MAKSGLIESRSKRAAGEVGRLPRVVTVQPQGTHSNTGEVSISLGDGGKIVHLFPHAVAFQQNPRLSNWDKKGEYNVIRFPQVASVKSRLQRGRQTATPEIVTNCNGGGNDDHHQRMRVNAFAAAVLVVLVISGEWIFSTLATVH
jgi:hypothetical protein